MTVRVLVVDDSATIRHLLTEILSRDPEIEVIGAAPEPAIARAMIRDRNPDVITLDVEMPNMNGLEFLEKIMRLRPMPVVMVSTLTARGTEVTLDALALGAVDCFAKPTHNVAAALDAAAQELARKVKTAARANLRHGGVRRPVSPGSPVAKAGPPFQKKLILLGASTGGVEALLEVLSHFPADCPPTAIVQHMPAGFTASFAARLDKLCAAHVAEARDGDALRPGHIYLAPGGGTHLEVSGRQEWRCRLVEDAASGGHRPSVDRLFHAAARTMAGDCVAALLTGMGRDGAAGLLALRQGGAITLGQDEASSVVYGMPRAAFEAGAVAGQLPLEKIGPELIRLCRQPALQEV
jgi:two-component system chemotaxis response regulator CheB